MQLCVQKGCNWIVIESDSTVLVQILKHTCQCPWSICSEVEQILDISHGVALIQHCLREANKVADILANQGYANSESLVCVYIDLRIYQRWLGANLD